MIDNQASNDPPSQRTDPTFYKFRVGDNDVDLLSMRINRASEEYLVEPKVLSVLRVLIDHAGEVVTRDDLIEAVWGSRFGGEERLSRAISLLRKALGDLRGQHQHIETVPKTGYRLIANVQPITPDPNTPRPTLGRFSYLRLATLACLILSCGGLLLWGINLTGPSSKETLPGEASSTIVNNSPDHSIAVLPFTDLSPDGDQQYFSDGLAEEILDALATVEELSVAGRTSSFAYRDGDQSIEEIGKALHVNFLLEGSVRKQGDTARVTTQLVRVSDGYHVWSKTFDGSLNDIFEFQESVARSIADEISPAATQPSTGRLARLLTEDREAYELYLQGREMSRRFGRQAKLTAIDLLGQAVERDANFADAWAWLARSHLFVPITDPKQDSSDHLRMARFAVKQALANDSNIAMGHYVNALLHDYDLNFDASFEAIERAYAAAPNQPFFAIRRGFYHLALGYVSLGSAMIEAGLLLDPTDTLGLLNLGQAKIHLGDVDEGMALIARSASLGFAPAGLLRCVHLGSTGQSAESYECWQQLPAVIKSRYPAALTSPGEWDDLGRIYAFGDQAAVDRIRSIVMNIAKDSSIPMSSYLFGVLQAVGETQMYLQSYVDRPFLLNASPLRFMWLIPNDAQRVTQDAKFSEFANRLGFTRTWQRHGWPDYCHSGSSEKIDDFYCN
ncbi:winged helix-turn-helix domain-containing protein [Congregibacter brevis]|uniref:Winged helix-turn-helix domain-containing protein n=1 Tax=Congregibacter brevis TaxID=3081201 RepID=A0ABZ0II73_9GAMM|nr:winged helix-turn-helix domain-containing protein [Congregibacter sp. IMCC45268]